MWMSLNFDEFYVIFRFTSVPSGRSLELSVVVVVVCV